MNLTQAIGQLTALYAQAVGQHGEEEVAAAVRQAIECPRHPCPCCGESLPDNLRHVHHFGNEFADPPYGSWVQIEFGSPLKFSWDLRELNPPAEIPKGLSVNPEASDFVSFSDKHRQTLPPESMRLPEFMFDRRCAVCGIVIPAGMVHEHLIPGPQFQPQTIYYVDFEQ